ncbi:hypothetical protein MIDIC_340021 [Alphaproteobacteria bacterium]
MLYHKSRDISEILLYRGIEVSYESIGEWNRKITLIIAIISVRKGNINPEINGI